MGWVILAVVVWVVTLLAVPQESFRRLVPFGILAGFGLGLLINILAFSIFGLYGFGQVVWPILGIPFWAVFTWIPAVILFVYYLPENSLPRLGWLLLFPAVFTAIEYFFLQTGLRFHSPEWNLFYAFLLSLGTHILVLSYYLTSVRTPARAVSTGNPVLERERGRR
jgi:hypothetical protein